MAIERLPSAEPTAPLKSPRPGTGDTPKPEVGAIGTDQARFSAATRQGSVGHGPTATPGAAHVPADYPHGATDVPHGAADAPHGTTDEPHHAEEPSAVDAIAHTAHSPHGAMHAFEAVETAARVAGRVIGRAGRAGAVAAEITHHGPGGHHGLLGKFEHAAEGLFKRVGQFVGGGIRRIPGGSRFLDGTKSLMALPGRILGPGVDGAIAGTRLGRAVQMTGSAGRFFATMGGRIPVIGAVFGGVIAVSDYNSTMKILRDPKATGAEMAVAGAQGGLSVVSGAVGVGALAAAGLAAIGLITAPAWIVPALGVAAVLGAASFVLTFFKKKTH